MNRIARRTLIVLTVALLLAPLVAIHAADKAPPSLRAGAAKSRYHQSYGRNAR